MLAKLRWQVAKLWRKWLGRRNRGSKPPSWEQFDDMLRVFPPIPEPPGDAPVAANPEAIPGLPCERILTESL